MKKRMNTVYQLSERPLNFFLTTYVTELNSTEPRPRPRLRFFEAQTLDSLRLTSYIHAVWRGLMAGRVAGPDDIMGDGGGSAYLPHKRAGPAPIHPAYLLHMFGVMVEHSWQLV